MIFALILFLSAPQNIPSFLTEGWRNSLNKNECSSIIFYYGRLKRFNYSFSKEDISRVDTCIKKYFPLKIKLKPDPQYQNHFFKLKTNYRLKANGFITIPKGIWYFGYVPALRNLATRLASESGIKIDSTQLNFKVWSKLPSFKIMVNEVSVNEYKKGKLGYPGKAMSNITFAEAEAFCKKTGGSLPDEFQFEVAARGGEYYRPFTWGEAKIPCKNTKNCKTIAHASDTSIWNIWNLGTGVAEFVKSSPLRKTSDQVIIKGGADGESWYYSMVASRRVVSSNFKSNKVGFRCVYPVKNTK